MSRQPFRYQDRTDRDYEDRVSQPVGDYESFVKSEYKIYKPHAGDNYVRFLPPTFDEPKHYGIDVWVHYSIGPDEASVICLQKMKKEPCPICEARMAADRRGDSTLADDLKPNRRVLVWLLDMKEAPRDRRPLLWPMGGSTDLDFNKHAKDRETGKWRRVDHPDDGLNVSFEREGTGLRTRYTGIQFGTKPSSVPDDDLDYIMDNPLPEVLRWRTYEQISELFDGSAKPRARDNSRERPREDDRDTRRDSRREAAPERDRDDRDRGRDDKRAADPEPSRSARERPRDDDRDSTRERRSDDHGGSRDDRPNGRDRTDDTRDTDRRSASATSDELRRRWNTDAPRDEPKRDADTESDAPRRRRTE